MATSFRPHIPTATDENARNHCRRRPLAVRPEWRTFPPGDLWTGRTLQEECFEWTIRSASRQGAAPPLGQRDRSRLIDLHHCGLRAMVVGRLPWSEGRIDHKIASPWMQTGRHPNI